MNIITAVYNFLWGDLITLPLPGGSSIGISLLVLLLVPAGIYFTIRTRFVLIRKFPHMIQIAMEKNEHSQAGSISGFQALIVATATRVGMGNLVGVVAAISAGGAGAVFWMWLLALLGSSTAFAEGTLAQIYRQKDPLYGGYRGGPAYYIHDFMTKKKRKAERTGKRETLQPDRGSVCDLWPDLLVRHQSGYQQLRKFCHEECISHSAAVHHDLPRRCGCDRCSSQKCHRSRPGCRCSNHGRLLSPDHTVCHHQKYRCTPFCVPADF